MRIIRRATAFAFAGAAAFAIVTAAQAGVPGKHAKTQSVAAAKSAPAVTPQITISPRPQPTCPPPVNYVQRLMTMIEPDHACPQ